MTIAELQALGLGYLIGGDLTKYISVNLLLKQYNVDNTILAWGVTQGIDDVTAAAQNRYNMVPEFQKVYNGGTRDLRVVKLTAIAAVRNIMGDAQNIGDVTAGHFEWLDATLKALRGGQFPLNQPGVAPITVTDPITQQPVTYIPDSRAEVVCSSFKTLG